MAPALVDDIEQRTKSGVILSNVFDLARNLGIELIVEGVVRDSDALVLRDRGRGVARRLSTGTRGWPT
ncbi:hypothetical protein [Silicimonas algicola]|uniref:hypothetical protein n=1 Tax=Silicimonas algicola TaxID=1826607 RepID=UPI001F496F4A|nr:hypothetical protein [Silicimonas algicola]